RSSTFTGIELYGCNDFGYQNGMPGRLLGLAGSVDAAKQVIRPTTESEIVAPGNMIAIGDSGDTDAAHNRVVSFYRSLARTSNAPVPDDTRFERIAKMVRERHCGKINLSFCDGHVESLKLERVFLDMSDDSLLRWNKDNEPHR